MSNLKFTLFVVAFLSLTQSAIAQVDILTFELEKRAKKDGGSYLLNGNISHEIFDFKRVDNTRVKEITVGDRAFKLVILNNGLRLFSAENNLISTVSIYTKKMQQVIVSDSIVYDWVQGHDKWHRSYYRKGELVMRFNYVKRNGKKMFIYKKFQEDIPGEELLILLANNYGVDLLKANSRLPIGLICAALMGVSRSLVTR